MIVVDSSAWIEYLRRTDHPVAARLDRAIETNEGVAVTEVVVAEVLSGVVDDRRLQRLHSLLLGHPVLRLDGLLDYEQAAALRRTCRRRGETIRSIADCLVAVPAIAADAPVLHADRDFDVLARHTPLRVVGV